jgi:probable HAF family extracellular repeat protein
MNSKLTTALALFVALAVPVQLAAQEQQHAQPFTQHFQRYNITDLGTLGGTWGYGLGINNKGWVVGKASMPTEVNGHAFSWRNGKITDLGTLGGPNSEPSFSPFSEKGDVGGAAETSNPDPNGEDFCFFGTGLICLPVLWHDGITTVLPTLGGNNGVANQVNNRGQVAGVAETTTLPPPCLGPGGEPVVWDNGVIQDLRVLPGDLAGVALAINDNGEAAGFSANCSTFHALLWRDGAITDLGSLGGTAFSLASAINNRGEVAGQSDLPGDTTSHAFLWRKGAMTDLGALPGDFSSNALGINSKTQIIGVSSDIYGNTRAFLWKRGTMIDLNNLIPAGSPWFLFEVDSINSRGEIVGGAFNTTTSENRAVLLTPCDEIHRGVEGCDYSLVDAAAASQIPTPIYRSGGTQPLPQSRRTNRYRIPGLQLPSK